MTATPRPGPARTGSLRLLNTMCEWPLSRRGLGMGYLLVGAILLAGGSLHPPLSSDVSAFSLPAGTWSDSDVSPEEILQRREPRLDSLGAFLTGLLALGVVFLVTSPRKSGWATGLVLAGAVAANFIAAINYPALIEELDREGNQRRQLAAVLVEASDHANMAYEPEGQESPRGRLDGEDGDPGLERGLVYLGSVRWLALWGLAGTLLAARGPVWRRAGLAAGWVTLGACLGAIVCLPRLLGEYAWARARVLEGQGDLGLARASLESALSYCPEFNRLRRTWLLGGKLDFAEGRNTSRALFFSAHRLALEGELRPARGMLEDLLTKGQTDVAVRNLAARVWTDLGLTLCPRPFGRSEGERPVEMSNGDLAGARAAWRRASALVPGKRDCAVYLGLAQFGTARPDPAEMESDLAPALAGLGDSLLRADLYAWLGDAYFARGRPGEARWYYARSCQAFSLPKIPNHRGLKGLGGL